MSTTVTLSSKYQIVIPQAAREALSLSAGDRSHCDHSWLQ